MKASISRSIFLPKDSIPQLRIVTAYMLVRWENVYLFEDCISNGPFAVGNRRSRITAECELRSLQCARLNLRHACSSFDTIGIEHRVLVVCE